MTNTNTKTYSEIYSLLTHEKPRSAWSRGVNNIAMNIVSEILEEYDGDNEPHFNRVDDFSKHFTTFHSVKPLTAVASLFMTMI